MSKRQPDLIALESSGFPRELVGRIAANMLLPEHGLLAPAPPALCRRWSLSAPGAAFVLLRFPGPGFMGGHRGGGSVLSTEGATRWGHALAFVWGFRSGDECGAAGLEREVSRPPGEGLDALHPPLCAMLWGLTGT